MRINLNTLKDLGYQIEIDESLGFVDCIPLGNSVRLDGLAKDLEYSGLSLASKDAVMGAAYDEYSRQQILLAITSE